MGTLGVEMREVLITLKARCRDCYRCLRGCPVKAIELKEGQAKVVASRCIACGTCIRECPQGAKVFRDDIAEAEALLRCGEPVAASVAPSFAGLFEDWERRRLPSALRRLGFRYVEETSVGAHATALSAREAQEGAAGPVLCTACPATVQWVEQYRPEAAPWLADVVSPMITHARALRQKDARTSVVFFGPCVAKKMEADQSEDVAVALTFEELRRWLLRAEIELDALEESAFDRLPGGEAAFFPAPGGLLRAAGLGGDALAMDQLVTEGLASLGDALSELSLRPRPILIESLFCHQGCLNGPAAASSRSLMARRLALIEFASARKGGESVHLELTHERGSVLAQRLPSFTEEEIRQVLEETGKGPLEARLDCGACGYESCRDKAIAVLQGMAEPEMCIPRMRHLAEQRTDRIIESSPNGILILDEHLHVLHINPAFGRLFYCSEAILGRPVSALMDIEPFERALEQPEAPLELITQHSRYGLTCKEIFYVLEEERQVVGIFVDLTSTRQRQEAFESLRARTAMHAKELMEHQIQLAQNVARILGESTARSESLVGELIELVDNLPEARPNAGSNEWQRRSKRKLPWGK